VSTRGQNPDAQRDAFTAAACGQVFTDQASGKLASRPELDKALLSANRAGDQLVVTKLDRLGRSLEPVMTVATWILAIATTVLALEGGTALLQWTNRLRPGRTRRELDELRREVTLLHTAAWMDVSTAGQGRRTEVDEKVRTMLMLDGWHPACSSPSRLATSA
jgi:hypothetical protein